MYLEDGSGKLAEVFEPPNESKLPDGSAIYGILLHKRGVAVKEFGACGAFETLESGTYSEDAVLRHINIHDLAVRPEQWTRTIIDGSQVMGPAGDVFRLTKAFRSDTNFRYKGNLLMDAQLAVGAMKKYCDDEGVSPEENSYYFGAVHVPEPVLQWASNTWEWREQKKWVEDLRNTESFECFGDAMSHDNKGAVGLRLAHVYNVTLIDVNISYITNEGNDDADPSFCVGVDPRYFGKDAYGAVFENSNVTYSLGPGGLQIDTATLKSTYGGNKSGLFEFYEIVPRRLQLNSDMNASASPPEAEDPPTVERNSERSSSDRPIAKKSADVEGPHFIVV
jgi:hypothetical protein